MKNKSIILISDNKKAETELAEKLLLLRNSDDIETLGFDAIQDLFKKYYTDVILLDSSGRETSIETQIRYIKEQDRHVFLILLSKSSEPDFIAGMYDCGIDDYILPSSTPADILIKVVNAIKRAEERRIAYKNELLLKELDVISSESGFYTERCANELINQEFEALADGVFMIVTYDELDRARFSLDALRSALSLSVRKSDTVVELKTSKFYILLPNTDISGGIAVFRKIKENLQEAFRLKAGIEKITSKDFRIIEQKASAALSEAMLSANDYCIYTEKEQALQEKDWNIEIEPEKKDFKLFRQKFLKKTENVITPVFYRLQKVFEDELPDTKIEQSTDEFQCIFHLKSLKQTSRLTIVYAGLGKIVLYITHSGLDSPENREIVLPLKDLTEKSLSDIVCTFVEEYKSCIDI